MWSLLIAPYILLLCQELKGSQSVFAPFSIKTVSMNVFITLLNHNHRLLTIFPLNRFLQTHNITYAIIYIHDYVTEK